MSKNLVDEMQKELENMQNQYLDEAVEGLVDEIKNSMKPKRNAYYQPSTWRYENERVERVTSYLKTNLGVEKANSILGKKVTEEEDDISGFISDSKLATATKVWDSPYFARVDYAENNEKMGKTIYIANPAYNSNTYLTTDTISWKEPLARLYYEKAFNQKLTINQKQVELDMLRDITIKNGVLIELHPEQRAVAETDPLLVERLATKKGDEMRELVNSLQAEQYELVRLPIEKPIIVQGSAGSGKSVIALHRLSYILYNHKQLNARQVAIFGPNALFLRHIKNVLPELGDHDIVQTTMKDYLEEMIPMREAVQEVDRMILSEVLDLSVNEGKKQVKREFDEYTKMRELKGSLLYKEYIEQYTKHIIGNLAPFMKNISSNHLTVSGLEIVQFIDNEQHYGTSKANLKHFVENQLRNKASKLSTIHDTLAKIIEDEVKTYLEDLEQHKFIQLSSPAIEKQSQVVRELWSTQQRMQQMLKERHYNFILDDVELSELESIAEIKERDIKKKEWASKKFSEKTNELNAQQKLLKEMIESFIKNKVKHMVERLNDLFLLSVHAKNQLVEQMNNYCDLFQKQFMLACATDLFIQKDYVTSNDIKHFIEEVNEQKLHEINDKWAIKRNALVEQLQNKILLEIKERFAYSLEQMLIENESFKDLKKCQVFLQASYRLPSSLNEKHVFHFEEIFEEVDSFYYKQADDVYKSIIEDHYTYAEQIEKDWDHSILKQFSVIEKHDLPALYIIAKHICPTFEKPFQYIIVDEAQDYTLFDMYVLNDLTNQIMLMGDLGQNLTPSNKLYNWQQFKEVIGDFAYYKLNATYRSTKQIVEFSNDIIRQFSKGKYELPEVTFRNGRPVEKITRSGRAVYTSINELINQLLMEDEQQSKIAIIAKTTREAKHLYDELKHPKVKLQIDNEYVDSKVIITTPIQAKGLEFDTVILFRFSRFSKTDDYDTKLAYVAASRALHNLYVYI